ncbi:ankyrin repeat domain-containing protein 7-like isoform X4 [Bolinopsis microptera]|uniref:ankyrin repeat domain-containing protein 7-like isoform X4 n=1 Tax=Bolinopsis microptera TaxID=2820187 RepID=UPI0030793A41
MDFQTRAQPNLVFAYLADYFEKHQETTPWLIMSGDAPAVFNSNSGGRFNNNSKTEQKLIEHIKNRDMRGIEKSIAYGASVKTADYKSDPPIMIAIDCGYKDITKLLLEHKQLKINEKARSGHTPLSYAAMTGKTDIVKVLIKEKAEINGLDGHGETPLIKAVTYGCLNAAEMLLNKGADTNMQSASGFSPLHIAVAKNNVNMVKLLLKQKNLKLEAENKNKHTALQMLDQHPNADIQHLLSTDSRCLK